MLHVFVNHDWLQMCFILWQFCKFSCTNYLLEKDVSNQAENNDNEEIWQNTRKENS